MNIWRSRIFLSQLVGQIKASKFVHNVIKLSLGTAIAQLIGFAASPILTRLYGPGPLGTFGMLLGIAGVATSFSSLKYDMAIVMPKADDEAKGLLLISLVISASFFIFFVLLLAITPKSTGSFLGISTDISLIWAILPYTAFSSAGSALMFFAIRKKQFSTISAAAVLSTASTSTISIAFGFIFKGSAYMLMYGAVAGQVIQFSFLLFFLGYREIKISGGTYYYFNLAKRFMDFPLYRCPQNVLNSISSGLPTIILASYASPAAAGFFWLANRVLMVPGTLVSESFRSVLYERASSLHRNGESAVGLIVKSTLVLAAVGIFPLLIIIIGGPIIFAVVFGQSWHESGEYARWMSLFIFAGFVNVPSVVGLTVYGGQHVLLIWEIVTTSTKIGLLVFCASLGFPPLDMVAAYSLVGVVAYAVLILLGIRRVIQSTASLVSSE